MESASEFAKRYFNDPFKKKGCLEKMVESRDTAIRKECAEIADDVGYELGLSNSERQVLVDAIESKEK